jgi:N-acetylmuramoyl-L-alanine amidase
VINNGSATASGRFYSYLYLDGNRIGYWYTDNLAAGYYAYVSDWSYTVNTPGWHTLKIVADATGAIAESNEGDNSWERSFYWQGVAQPNLTPYTPSGWDYPIVPSSVQGTTRVNTLYAGQPTYIDWAVINNGSATASGRFYSYLYLDGTRIGSWYKDNLQAGYYTYVSDWSYTVSTPGWHTLKIVADATGAIAESNENDNTWERNFYWEGGGGVTVTSVWTTDGSGNNKTTFNCGDSIRYYGNVYNNTGSSKTAYFNWSVTGPCGSIASWSGNLTTGTGNQSWYLPATIPSNACAGTYTYKLSVTYSGSTSSKSTTFTVNCGIKKVVLDPGHGWCRDGYTPGANCPVTPGASGYGMVEKDVVLDIANRTKSILQGRGIQVYMTRTDNDPYHHLSYAAQYVNQVNPNIAASIHANAAGGTGTEACYQDRKSTTPQSKDLSQRLTNAIASRLSLTNRGIFSEYDTGRCGRGGKLYIHDMNPTAALIETAFIDNANDADKLRNRRQDFAQAIADALLAYLGVP